MDWVPPLVTAIGSIRLILIFTGILMLLRCIFKPHTLSDHQKQYFALSGIIYLFGLMPQSLLLLFTNSDSINYMLDSGYLCWIQKFACIIAVALHTFIFLSWISSLVRCHTVCDENSNALINRITSKEFIRVLVIYVILLIMSRMFFLKIDDDRRFYADVVSRTDNASFTGWTLSPVQNPAQVVRLQLLLCESSLSANDMKYFLTICYLLLFLPLVFMFCLLKPLLFQAKQATEISKIYLEDSSEGWQHRTWWSQETNVQKILSAAITFWYLVVQPTVFAFQRQHFIDFGTHLLLTICVFIPWTLSPTEQKNIQSWV